MRGKNDEDLRRRSGSPTDPGYGRGIGSLLRRNAGSRVDLYEDSDDDYAEVMPMTAGGGRLDAGMPQQQVALLRLFLCWHFTHPCDKEMYLVLVMLILQPHRMAHGSHGLVEGGVGGDGGGRRSAIGFL